MYNEKVRSYYRKFYGKTYYNMSDISECVNYDKMKGIKDPSLYEKNKQFFYVYKLEWGNGNTYWGCTGQKPHKRLQNHCWDRGLDKDKVKMIVIKAYFDRNSAEMDEQWYIDQNYNTTGNHNKN